MVARYKLLFFSTSQTTSTTILLETQGDTLGSDTPVVSSSVERWFVLHRGAQSVGALLSIAGVVCALFSMGCTLTHWHNRLGYVVPFLLIAQVTAATARPSKDEVEKRRRFLTIHRVLGGLALFFGLFCVWTGAHMAYGEPLTVYFDVVGGCILVAFLLVVACEVKLASGTKGVGRVAALAAVLNLQVAGMVSVAAVLLVGHYHVHLDST